MAQPLPPKAELEEKVLFTTVNVPPKPLKMPPPLEPPLDKPVELMTLREKMRTGLRYLPMAPVVFRWKNIPITAYLARYKNDFLREALKAIASNEHMSALVLVMVGPTRRGLLPEQLREPASWAANSFGFQLLGLGVVLQLLPSPADRASSYM